MAIWSLVLGILSILLCLGLLTGIPGLILGIVGSSRIKHSAGQLTGAGLAIAGIVCSGVGLVFGTATLAAVALPTFFQAGDRAKVTESLRQLKEINLAIRTYAIDNDDEIPQDLETLHPRYIDERAVFTSPYAEEENEVSYEVLLSGKLGEHPANAILLRDLHTNIAGKRIVGRVDGSATLEEPDAGTDP